MIKSENKNIIVLSTIVVIVILVLVCVSMKIRSSSPERRLQEQLNLGYKYLSDLNYEQAVAAFEAAIEIDPKRIDGYVGLVEAYIGQNDASNMLDIYEMAEANLSADDADAVRQNIIDSVVAMIETARNDGDDILVEELLGILGEIDPDNIERYRQLYVSTELADADLQVADEGPDTDAYLVRVDVDGDYSYYAIYEYTDNGYNVTTFIDGDAGTTNAFAFNEYGDCTYETMGDYETSFSVFTTEYEYDNTGRCIQAFITHDFYYNGEFRSQNKYSALYEYDSHGNYTVYYEYGESKHVEVDDLGNEIYFEYTDANGIVTTGRRVYDSRGNVVMTEYEDGERLYYTNTYSDSVVLTYENP